MTPPAWLLHLPAPASWAPVTPTIILADTCEGQLKEAEVTGRAPSEMSTYGNIRQGFVYERVPHITLKAIANNAEIDVIWETAQEDLEPLREALNRELDTSWEEWEIPRDPEDSWSKDAKELHRQWWERRIARQKDIDASIASHADFEYLYDKPYEDNGKSASPGPSPWRASPPTASWALTKTARS